MKKCNQCGKAGLFLRLNKDGLCKSCERDNLKLINLSSEELVNTLSNAVKTDNNKELKKIEKSLEAQNRISKRQRTNFDIVYNKYNKARELERSGNTDKALKIYLSLIEYRPPGTDYYTRPCIILEKQKKYKEAIEICDIAIEEINNNNFNANVSEFTKRLERLKKKFEKNKQ